MLRYALRRVLEMIPTTVGVLLLTFALFNVVGGSPAEAVLGKNASAESIAAFNRQYGFDRPLVFARDSQFVRFLSDLARGDFGYSVEYDEPVLDVLARGVGPSLSLTVPILVGSVVVGLALALGAVAFRGRAVDHAVLLASAVLTLIIALISLVAVSLAAIVPALGLIKKPLVELAKAKDDINVSLKETWLDRKITYLFGTAGQLASASYQNHKKRYRVFSLSIALSCSLFLLLKLFCAYIMQNGGAENSNSI